MSQVELARRLKLSRQMMWQVEMGKRPLRAGLLRDAAKALNCDVAYLLHDIEHYGDEPAGAPS